MIRINLLPERRARRVRRIRRILLVTLALVIGVPVMIEAVIWYTMDRRVEALEGEKVVMAQELEVLKAKVKEIENVERDNKAIEDKQKVIEQLRTQQGKPVRLLSEVSKALPPKVWLVTFSEQGGKLDLTGMAQTNADLVDFVLQLQRSPLFKEVTLVESHEVREATMAVYAFTLACTLSG